MCGPIPATADQLSSGAGRRASAPRSFLAHQKVHDHVPRIASRAAIRERLERARAEGDLPAEADPAALTHYIGTVVCGMAVLAASGATRTELERVIELTMRAWPQ